MNLNDYQQLIKQLNQYAYHYYVLDAPTILDSEYDEYYQQLLSFEQENPLLIDSASPTQRIGDQPLDHFDMFQHTSVLPSLGNVFDKESLDHFCQRLAKENQKLLPPLSVEKKN